MIAVACVAWALLGGFKDSSKRLFLLSDICSVMIACITGYLATKCSKKAIDFVPLGYVLFRTVSLVFMLKMNEKEVHGFSVDVKFYTDFTFITLMPAVILLSSSVKIDLLLTFPLMLLINSGNIKMTLHLDNNNMSCFSDPLRYSGEKTNLTNFTICLLFFF